MLLKSASECILILIRVFDAFFDLMNLIIIGGNSFMALDESIEKFGNFILRHAQFAIIVNLLITEEVLIADSKIPSGRLFLNEDINVIFKFESWSSGRRSGKFTFIK